MKIAIISINRPSFKAALKLARKLEDFEFTIYTKGDFESKDFKVINFVSLDHILPSIWKEVDAIVAILAIGAVVRKIAPLLEDKSKDPAVIVINLALDKIVPLIGGHLAGANELSTLLAKRLNAINFISTATDQTKTIAFDLIAKKNNWRIKNLHHLARISNALLNYEASVNEEKIKVVAPRKIFEYLLSIDKRYSLENISFDEVDNKTVIISPFQKDFDLLTLIPKVSIGIGCAKGISKELIQKALKEFLKENKILLEDIECFCSFEAKMKEKGLIDFAKELNKELKFFSKEEIDSVKLDPFLSLSKSFAKEIFEIAGVAEPCAILGSRFKELIIKKRAFFGKITFALAI